MSEPAPITHESNPAPVPGDSHAVPQAAAVRLLHLFSNLLAAVEHGLDSGVATETHATRWRRAQQKLKQDLSRIEAAAKQNEQGRSGPLTEVGGRLRFLARDMDGFRLDFAGPEIAERLEQTRRLVVLTAWQVHAAGTGSKASGL